MSKKHKLVAAEPEVQQVEDAPTVKLSQHQFDYMPKLAYEVLAIAAEVYGSLATDRLMNQMPTVEVEGDHVVVYLPHGQAKEVARKLDTCQTNWYRVQGRGGALLVWRWVDNSLAYLNAQK